MRILITTDAVGGVWTYTKELALGLAQRGHELRLICFGGHPTEAQKQWIAATPRVALDSYELKLEWMHGCESDVAAAMRVVEREVDRFRPHVLHTNQYCFATVNRALPKIAVAHSDVVSWWHAVHLAPPNLNDFPHLSFYKDQVTACIRSAEVTVAVSNQVREDLRRHFGEPRQAMVIYNGVSPERFDCAANRENFALCVGRVWDKAKNVEILTKVGGSLPVRMVGDADAYLPGSIGVLSEEKLRGEYARALVYISPALYEPFGLAVLEAAMSGCRLLLSDIASFREIWGDYAEYFNPRDPEELQDKMSRVRVGLDAREHARSNYTADRMVNEYERLYSHLLGCGNAAA